MIRVYRYGARADSIGPQLRDQMDLGHRYYNRLVEAENARRREAWGCDRPPAPPHDDCACDDCCAHWQSVRKTVKEAGWLDVKPLRAEAVEAGLFWGTYLVIEQAFKAAVQKTDLLRTVRFRSWRQGAQAAVQIQKGVKGQRWWRLTPQADGRQGRRSRGQRGRYLVQIRIGSDGREPVWSEPVRIERHRLHEGRVVWVRVVTTWVGDRERASVQLVCRECDEKHHGEGAVAVDASWRKVDGHLRLAWARDDDGDETVLTLPREWLERGKRADRIRAARDRLLNRLIASDERFSRVRSQRGAARVIGQLDNADVTDTMRVWLKRDRHLWQYEVGCRRRSVARRRDAMRKWVADLRSRYRTVVVKDTSHKLIKEQAREAKVLHQAARRQGHHGAPGELIELLRREMANLVIISAPYTTQACLECGHETEHGQETLVTCESCGAVDDRDRVSTENLLRRYRAGEGGEPTARKAAARFAKRHVK